MIAATLMTTRMIFASLVVTLTTWTTASWTTCIDALPSDQWWQRLLSVSAQLVEVIFVISFVHVGELWKSDLIAATLIFQFI